MTGLDAGDVAVEGEKADADVQKFAGNFVLVDQSSVVPVERNKSEWGGRAGEFAESGGDAGVGVGGKGVSSRVLRGQRGAVGEGFGFCDRGLGRLLFCFSWRETGEAAAVGFARGDENRTS